MTPGLHATHQTDKLGWDRFIPTQPGVGTVFRREWRLAGSVLVGKSA